MKTLTNVIRAASLLLIAGTLVFSLGAAPAGKTTICHCTGQQENPEDCTIEIVISDNALQVHLDHGDDLGSCI